MALSASGGASLGCLLAVASACCTVYARWRGSAGHESSTAELSGVGSAASGGASLACLFTVADLVLESVDCVGCHVEYLWSHFDAALSGVESAASGGASLACLLTVADLLL